MFIGKGNIGAVSGPFFPLKESAAIDTPCTQGNNFAITLTANDTINNPTLPADGQVCTWAIKQGGSGSYIPVLGSKFNFGSTITSITWSTAVGATDYFSAIYNLARDKWDIVAFVGGFT